MGEGRFTKFINAKVFGGQSEEEARRVLSENRSEEEWYQDKPPFATGPEINEAIEKGELVEIPRRNFYHQDERGRVKSAATAEDCPPGRYCGGFVLSGNIKGDYRPALSWPAASLLETMSLEWGKRMQASGEKISLEQGHLFVTSLTRSAERQRELAEVEKRPAAEADKSTHTKGGAFDVSTTYFGRSPESRLQHAKRKILGGPEKKAAEVLEEVAKEYQERGACHCIHESGQKILHVAVNPEVPGNDVRLALEEEPVTSAV